MSAEDTPADKTASGASGAERASPEEAGPNAAGAGDAAAAAEAARRVVGRVVSSKMQKSVTVSIQRFIRHPVYGKYIRRTGKVMAHDEDGACAEGDLVAIAECRPISKHKAWRVVEVLEKAAPEEAGARG